jgi:RNA polymerase sigma-70 factor (ECF subfamily)
VPNDTDTDSDLIDGWRRGEESAAAALIRRHAGSVARFLHAAGADGDDVEDLVQETFFRAFRRIETFRGGSTFRTWVIAIGSNVLKDTWRKRSRQSVIPLDGRDFADESMDPFAESEAREMERRLAKGVQGLSPMQRDVFLLRAQQGVDYDEIAKVLRTSPGAARVHYHHAVQRLKKVLSVELET